MKNAMKYMIAGMAGIGAYMAYKKYMPNMMNDVKQSMKKAANDVSTAVENMK